MVYQENFAAKAQARAAVFQYIEMFYNSKRLHAALNYLSLEAFEACRVGEKFDNGEWVRSVA